MESLPQRTEIEIETLNPLSRKLPGFSSYAPRRSHLDSASYRSLVRILSRCVDQSLVPPAPAERTLDMIQPTSSREGGELPLDQAAGANINGGTSLKRQDEGDRFAVGGGHEGSLVSSAELMGIDVTVFDDDFEASVNSELLSRYMSCCQRLIDVPNVELCSSGGLLEEKVQVGDRQIVDKELEILKACSHGVVEGVSNLNEVSEVAKGDAKSERCNGIPDSVSLIGESNSELCLVAHEQSGQEEIVDNDFGISKACVHGAEPQVSNFETVLGVYKEDANSKLIRRVSPDCDRTIDAPIEELKSSAGTHDGNVQDGYEKMMDNDLISKAFVCGAKDGISDPGKVLEDAMEDELERILPNVPEGGHNSMKESEGGRKTTGDVSDVKIHVTKTAYDKSHSLMESSDIRNLEEDHVNTLAHQIHEGGFEEGEIPNEIQDLEGQIDINDEERVQGPKSIGLNKVASTSTFVHKEGVLELGTYNPSTIKKRGSAVDHEVNLFDTSENDSTDEETQRKQMVMSAREKKQRGPLTEERKAKKKIAKKRKRAQKNREQGVKKLKLYTITKPKEVKICNFYLMGRCQQGDLCKYSHDAPLIKSTPCKYFASNSCLKGDDCMFDHELSKYPCHKFISTGSCIRGDGCKFSHQIPTIHALTSSKIESHLASEPTKLRKQPVCVHGSSISTGPLESNDKATPSSRHTLFKEATQVPKGIRFLSFGEVKTDLTNQVEGNLPVKKSSKNGAYNQHQSALSVASCGSVASSNGFTLKDSCNITESSSITTPGTVNHELSEATKILEEFLFCGAS